MFNNNSISVSVSDDEADELGRMRVRVRRKRKKLGQRLKHRIARKLVRYWALLIFLPALGLFLFEASRIGKKPSLVESERNTVKNPSLEKNSDANLNRLDHTTRVVGGVRQRCLDILSPEELEQLEIPVRGEFDGQEITVLNMTNSKTTGYRSR